MGLTTYPKLVNIPIVDIKMKNYRLGLYCSVITQWKSIPQIYFSTTLVCARCNWKNFPIYNLQGIWEEKIQFR